MSVTIKDVAKRAGVSASTVSRVVNADCRISDKTRNKVLACMDELGYQVNNIARSLKTNRTMTVGFISPELTNDVFMNIARGAEDEFRKHGYNIIICNSNENIIDEEDRIRLLIQKCTDGMIIIPASPEGKHYRQIREAGQPLVLVDRLVADFESDAVLVDNINGSYTAVEYLINRGHRRIGFIGGDIRLTSAEERFEGYRRALADYCIPMEESIIRFGDYHVESGYRIMKEMAELPDPPRYVFISNYYMHLGAMKYLLEKGRSIKKRGDSGDSGKAGSIENGGCTVYDRDAANTSDVGNTVHAGKTGDTKDAANTAFSGNTRKDISIAAFDDMEFSGILGFSDVRVAQPMEEIGSRAARLLLSHIDGEELPFPQIIRLKTTLKISG